MLPADDELPAKPERAVWHWTAGPRAATAHDLERYHVLIEAWANEDKYRLQSGVPVARNMREVRGLPGFHNDPETGYAAHVRGLNSFSIGIAMCGMREARDSTMTEDGKVDPGPEPITAAQVEGLVDVSADCAIRYGLEPVPRQMLGHYEVGEVYGIEQAGKWDPSFLPLDTGDAKAGDWLRAKVHEEVQRRSG